ncbi:MULTISPECIES: hypothetical protein [Bacillaceae]|uniref:hypothetical protein n=1 Tax=Bacillaceae TaxID=186817 RepID=UPI00115DD786|nr:hypothetical protein [Bacillus sp. PK3_68]
MRWLFIDRVGCRMAGWLTIIHIKRLNEAMATIYSSHRFFMDAVWLLDGSFFERAVPCYVR